MYEVPSCREQAASFSRVYRTLRGEKQKSHPKILRARHDELAFVLNSSTTARVVLMDDARFVCCRNSYPRVLALYFTDDET